MTPCHSQKYAEALTGMRQYASRMWQGTLPPWAEAAMQQHAHYYAAQACGEQPMAYGTFNDYAAYGITRRGTEDGRIVRTISMAGFGGFGAPPPANKADFTTLAASNWLNEGCTRAAVGQYPASGFCLCMYGDGDKIAGSNNKDHTDFTSGTPRWACQLMAEYNYPPWSDDSLLFQIIASGGKADPLKSLPSSEKIAAYKAMIQNVGEKQIGIPGTPLSFKLKDAAGILEQKGIVPPGSITATSAIIGSATPDELKASAKKIDDTDLITLLQQLGTPDPARDPAGAIWVSILTDENNWRAANPCAAGRRSIQYGLDANGRVKCGGRAIGGTLPRINRIYGTTDGLIDALKKQQQGGQTTESKMPTALIVGGIAAAVAAVFLLKK